MLKSKKYSLTIGLLAALLAWGFLNGDATTADATTYFKQDFEDGQYMTRYLTESDQTDANAVKFNRWSGQSHTWITSEQSAKFTNYSMKVRFVPGSHYGRDFWYFRKNAEHKDDTTEWGDSLYVSEGTELDEAYLRYYIRFDTGFSNIDDTHSGKIPGLAGTRMVGAGGSTSDGTTDDGWSARVAWKKDADSDSLIITGYIYSVNQARNIPSPNNYAPKIDINKWYYIEEYVKMNSFNPSDDDGLFTLKIQNKKRIEVTGAPPNNLKMYDSNENLLSTQTLTPGLKYSSADSCKINQLWAEFFYGYGDVTPSDTLYLWFDEIEMTSAPIGAKRLAEPAEYVALPRKVSLGQNEPNPFNSATTINYTLAEDGLTQLTVYNLNGQMVRKLVNVFLPAGSHAANWDGRDAAGLPVSSGTYLYKLQTEKATKTRKLMLIR